jgi:hypothetical protein
MNRINIFIIAILALILSACVDATQTEILDSLLDQGIQTDKGELTIIYPRDGTVFPPEAVSPIVKQDDKTPVVNTHALIIGHEDTLFKKVYNYYLSRLCEISDILSQCSAAVFICI